MKEIKTLALVGIFALLLPACVAQQKNTHTSVSPAANTVTYVCGDGVTILASYPDVDSATVQYKGTTYDLHIARSADGSRYVGSGIEWWTKGSGVGSHGTLFQHNEDGTSGKRLEFCTFK